MLELAANEIHIRSVVQPRGVRREQGKRSQAILQEWLARYLNVSPNEIAFKYNAHGKPTLAAPTQADQTLSFNLSDSADLVVMAFSWNRPLGIDIEQVRSVRYAEQILQRYFSGTELEAYREAPDDQKAQVFLEYWTAHEALIKAHGVGILTHRQELDPDRWNYYRFKPAADTIGTLAYPQQQLVIREIGGNVNFR